MTCPRPHGWGPLGGFPDSSTVSKPELRAYCVPVVSPTCFPI